MKERELCDRSLSLVRRSWPGNVSWKPKQITRQETELDGTTVELQEEVNSVTNRQVKGRSDSSNNVVM